MPRKPRQYLPGVPAHVVQRGNNRDACFFADDDYLYYLHCLRQGLLRYHVQCHAYALMTNHVHLLLTPQSESGISNVMQHVGRLYVQFINKTYHRSGTLWEGRHKASLIDAEKYLLSCYRYIEMNPVVAGMVASPDEYRWSSYRRNGWGKVDDIVSEHTLYKALGGKAEERQQTYRELFRYQLPIQTTHEIKEALTYNHPLGNDRFREQIEQALGRSVGEKKRGRPFKQQAG